MVMPNSVRVFSAVLVIVSVLGCATTAVHRPELAARLRQQADAWDRAIIAKDAAAIAKNMSETFQHVDSQGRLSDKKQFLLGILSKKLSISPYQPEDVEIRFYGEVALVTGTTQLDGSYNDAPFKSHYRYTDTYANERGAWRVVNVQTTEITE